MQVYETIIGTQCSYIKQLLEHNAGIWNNYWNIMQLYETIIGTQCSYMKQLLEHNAGI